MIIRSWWCSITGRPWKKNCNPWRAPWKTNLRVSPPLTPGKKNNTLEKKLKHSTWTPQMHSQNMLCDSLAVHRIFGTRAPKHYTTTGPENHRTRGPEDDRTRGPQDQRTKQPEDQTTRGPEDHRTKVDQRTRGPNNQRTKQPKDQTTRGPQGQRSLNFFSSGCKYFFQGTWFFFSRERKFVFQYHPLYNLLPFHVFLQSFWCYLIMSSELHSLKLTLPPWK